MKKIDVSNVTSTSRQPLLGRSIDHLQQGVTESIDALAQKITGKYNTNDVVIMYGCNNTGSSSGAGNPFNVSAGAVYYNGEIYLVDAVSGNFTGTNVLVGNVVTTYQSGDPVTMTDGTLKNVHQIRKIVITQGASGSGGVANHTSWIQTEKVRAEGGNSSYVIGSNAYTNVTTLNYTTPNDGYTRTWQIVCSGQVYNSGGVANFSVDLKLYNSTAATDLQTCTVNLQIGGGGTITSDYRPYALNRIVTLAPNTTIVVQAKSATFASSSPTLLNNIFNIVEL